MIAETIQQERDEQINSALTRLAQGILTQTDIKKLTQCPIGENNIIQARFFAIAGLVMNQQRGAIYQPPSYTQREYSEVLEQLEGVLFEAQNTPPSTLYLKQRKLIYRTAELFYLLKPTITSISTPQGLQEKGLEYFRAYGDLTNASLSVDNIPSERVTAMLQAVNKNGEALIKLYNALHNFGHQFHLYREHSYHQTFMFISMSITNQAPTIILANHLEDLCGLLASYASTIPREHQALAIEIQCLVDEVKEEMQEMIIAPTGSSAMYQTSENSSRSIAHNSQDTANTNSVRVKN